MVAGWEPSAAPVRLADSAPREHWVVSLPAPVEHWATSFQESMAWGAVARGAKCSACPRPRVPRSSTCPGPAFARTAGGRRQQLLAACPAAQLGPRRSHRDDARLFLQVIEHDGVLRDGIGDDAGLGQMQDHTSELQSLRHLVCRLLLEK